jgi:hypothetical protein
MFGRLSPRQPANTPPKSFRQPNAKETHMIKADSPEAKAALALTRASLTPLFDQAGALVAFYDHDLSKFDFTKQRPLTREVDLAKTLAHVSDNRGTKTRAKLPQRAPAEGITVEQQQAHSA